LTSCKIFWACLIGLKDRNRGDSCCIMLLLVLLLFPGADRWKLVGREGCEEKLVVFWDPKNASDWLAITFWTWLISSRFLSVCTQNQTTPCETPDIYIYRQIYIYIYNISFFLPTLNRSIHTKIKPQTL